MPDVPVMLIYELCCVDILVAFLKYHYYYEDLEVYCFCWFLFLALSDFGPSLPLFSWYQQPLLKIADILKKYYYLSAFIPFWKHI